MLNAGICAPVPKGDWLNNVQYDPLNMVNHGGYSWIAKRQSLGQEPTEGQYWMQFGTAVPIATTSVAGKVKPDGVSILITGEGVISALLSGLTDVELTDLEDGQVIAWDETENKFVNKDISTTLAGLQDVDLTGLQDGQILAFNAETNKWEPIDPPSGGFSEVLIDYDPAEMTGITVTLAHAASAEGHTPESYTITLDNTGEVEQDVKNLGLWTITWTHNGQSYTESFDIHYFGYFHVMLHEGFTWRLWATAGGIPINQYNSLSQLLADEAAVRRLFIVHDAVDYMCENANSTQNQDLITIINNGLCAKWANLNDYALDNMEADAVLSDLMDEADLYGYGELIEDNGDYVPKGNVPVMTSNTAPYGEAIANPAAASGYAIYNVFDDNDTTSYGTTWASDVWVGYKFTNPVNVKKVFVDRTYVAGESTTIQYSDDGSTWSDAANTSSYSTDMHTVQVPDSGYHLYWRARFVAPTTSGNYIRTIQFYGRELKVSVPTMTSNTAPYGEASASSEYGISNKAFNAFDKDTTKYWCNAWNASATWQNTHIDYDFGKPVCLGMVVLKPFKDSNGVTLKDYAIEGSNDGSTWDSLGTGTVSTDNEVQLPISSNLGYTKFRLKPTSASPYTTDNDAIAIRILQFYGKDYSEKEFANDGSKWLYDHGVLLDGEEMSTANGWTAYNGNDAGTFSAVTFESGYAVCNAPSNGNVSGIGAQLDLTDYSQVFVIADGLTIASNSYGSIQINSAKDNSNTRRVAYVSMPSGVNKYNLDVSSQNAQYAVMVDPTNGRAIKLFEMWLE